MTSTLSSEWRSRNFVGGIVVKWNAFVIPEYVSNTLSSTKVCQEAVDILQQYPADLWEIVYPSNRYKGNPVHANSATIPDPSDRQVGGSHYKNLSIEPWKAMESWLSREEYIGFLRGNIIKYQARANSGKEDKEIQIAKAKHYADELESFLSRSKPISNSPS